MVFIDDVKQIYKNVVNDNNYDTTNKTINEIVDDFKVHIMKNVNSILVYAVYTSSRFVFINPISDELLNQLKDAVHISISENVVVNNNISFSLPLYFLHNDAYNMYSLAPYDVYLNYLPSAFEHFFQI